MFWQQGRARGLALQQSIGHYILCLGLLIPERTRVNWLSSCPRQAPSIEPHLSPLLFTAPSGECVSNDHGYLVQILRDQYTMDHVTSNGYSAHFPCFSV